ncbi:hypothetical protein EG329_008371 [Mollisiaceae sp. DMI_Dod_QoI]|nr:hypothetical protein EG329_008371 [Helotiales sp. DMI_Dod_QoI]
MVRPHAKNPNAPEHLPEVATDQTIIKAIAEKLFSEPDPEAAQVLNQRIKALNDVNQRRHQIKKLKTREDLPEYPPFSSTPKATESNVCKGTKINSRQGLRILDQNAGTPTICTDAYLQFICDYANLWHSKNSGVDCRSPGTDPKYFYLAQDFHRELMARTPQNMANETRKRLSRRQFWKLRYLFIPISFVPGRQDAAHVAVCAVSPEAKFVDYVCSGGDSGLPDSPRSDGAHCMPKLFAWLAEFIGNEQGAGFVPSEWKLRTGAGRLQNLWRGDCGIYTVTHVLTLAFGYGYGEKGGFPKDHQHRIIKRRKRYVQDLMLGGFSLYEEGASNCQYYPLIDKKPEALRKDGFHGLPQSVLNQLPKWARPIKACYAKCPNKSALKLHCRRNAKLYPGFDKPNISGRGIKLAQFIQWVEDMDEQWAKKVQDGCGAEWIDPRFSSQDVTPKRALWGLFYNRQPFVFQVNSKTKSNQLEDTCL